MPGRLQIGKQLALLLALSWGASSQALAAAPRPFRIATLDLERLFEEHPLHQALVELVKEQAEFANQQAQRQRKRLSEAQRRLAKAEKGTREYKRIQDEIERLQLDEELTSEPDGLPIDGGVLFGRIVKDIHETTERYREQHGISLVLRRSTDEVNEADPPAVFGSLQRIVLYDEGLDITDAVLAEIRQATELPER